VKNRRDFIEADYVDGVFNEKGEQTIRALNEVEREFLSQFYAEEVHGNFAKTKEISAQEAVHKQLNRQMRETRKLISSEEVLELQIEIDKAYKKLVHLRSETNTFYPEDADRHEIFKNGNNRREDVFNRAKSANKLIAFDVPEYDAFTSRAEKSINPEHLVLEYLTKKPVKRTALKKRKNSSEDAF